MKQMNIKRIALCAIALLTAGMASATTETYDFTGFTNNTITTADTESKGKVNGQNINLLQIGTETFNNRFAVSRVGGAAGGAWVAKNWNDQKGLFTSYNDRYFTILGLNDGDKVTITWSTDNAGTLKFFDAPAITGKSAGDAVESGTTYTISTSEDAVNVNLFADGSGTATALYIKSVVIETPVSSETIYIGQTMDTYNLEAITGSIDDNNPVTIGGTAYSRFSTERKDLFQVSGEGWGWQVNYNKWFAINDLKAGDKVWIKYTKSDGQTVAFGDATQIGETGTVELESEKWYTLAKNADQLKLVNQVNTNGLKANYKEIRIISTDNSILQSTLVSANGLDFSGLSAKAYVATKAAGGVVTFQQVNKVAPNTPVYLKADAAGAVEVPIIDGGYDDVTTNLLKGSASAASAKLTSDGDDKYYVFGMKDETVGFYRANGYTCPAGKAYLQLTAAQAAAAPMLSLVFVGNEAVTGIEKISYKKIDNSPIFNLNGQRVSNMSKGLYIVNGRVVVIK